MLSGMDRAYGTYGEPCLRLRPSPKAVPHAGPHSKNASAVLGVSFGLILLSGLDVIVVAQ